VLAKSARRTGIKNGVSSKDKLWFAGDSVNGEFAARPKVSSANILGVPGRVRRLVFAWRRPNQPIKTSLMNTARGRRRDDDRHVSGHWE